MDELGCVRATKTRFFPSLLECQVQDPQAEAAGHPRGKVDRMSIDTFQSGSQSRGLNKT